MKSSLSRQNLKKSQITCIVVFNVVFANMFIKEKPEKVESLVQSEVRNPTLHTV